jgi:hypothetical protein
MTTSVPRHTVDLSAYPDLVVIYLGLRVNTLRGLKTILGPGAADPKGGRRQAGGAITCRTKHHL